MQSGFKWRWLSSPIDFVVAHNHLSYFPLRKTLRGYTWKRLLGDANAGLNTSLLSFPQGIAYALIAGLPIAYGIYASVIAAFFGSIFSRSPFAALGPTNSTCVLLMSTFAILGFNAVERVATLPLLILMVGLMLTLGAYFKIGNLIQYISRSVITGYVTASAALILANQAWQLLGIHFDKPAITFYEIVYQTVLHLNKVEWPTVFLGILTLILYLGLNRQFKTLPNIGITLVLSSLFGLGFQWMGWPLHYTEAIQMSSWPITMPVINFAMIKTLASSALAITLLCLLENASIVKGLAAKGGQRFDINQEMFAMGISNLGATFLAGMPISTSPTRSTLSWKSGATSGLNNVFSGLFCLGMAVLLGPFTAHIPIVTLSALIIIVGTAMIHKHAIRVVMRSTPSDAIVFIATLVTGLIFPLDNAVYLGVLISIALFLRTAAVPQMVEYMFTETGQLTEREEGQPKIDLGISIVHVEGNLFFAAADLFHDQIRRVCEDKHLKVVILKMRNAYHLDATSVMALEELVLHMKEKNRVLLISEARRDLIKIFKRSGLMDVIGKEHIFADNFQNPTLSTARALRKAQELIGANATRITIYAGAHDMETPA